MTSGIFKDLSGLKFGRLEVLHRIPNQAGKVMWKCLCVCGKSTSVRGDSFNNIKQNTRSCGCLQKETARKTKGILRKPRGEKITNDLFANYKRRARNKNLEWSISRQIFTDTIKLPCSYCGKKDSNKAVNPRIKTDFILYNGIDRIDSSFGYTTNNIVPCCCQCNYAKSDYTKQEFFDWITRVYNFNFKWEPSDV